MTQTDWGFKLTRFQVVLASVVTAVWVISILARIFVKGAPANEFNILDSIVLLVYGFIFSAAAIRKNGATTTTEPKKEEPAK